MCCSHLWRLGLYYFNARWYDPTLGRFITEDPIKDGTNWHVYTNNNPINFIDPTGLSAESDKFYGGLADGSISGYNSQTNWDKTVGKQEHKNGKERGISSYLKETLAPLAQAIMDLALWATGAEVGNLSSSYVDKLVDEILANADALDDKTKEMVDNMARDHLIDHFSKVRVMTNVNEGIYKFFTGLFGMKYKSNAGASAIGNTIYERNADFSSGFALGGTEAEKVANLIGHEAIHTLQSAAYGGVDGFLIAYGKESKDNGYYGNKFEIAAYSFGPNNKTIMKNLPQTYRYGNYVFARNPGWWK